MGKETKKILELLSHWEEYQQQALEEGDIAGFGSWLQHKYQPKLTVQPGAKQAFRDQYIHDKVSTDKQIALLWGRLQRFTHLWSRKAVQGLPINSTDEFGLIKTVDLLGSVRKTDIARYILVESTTCFEMIKRLVKAGFLKEETDPEDRRSRLVSLTKKGKELSILSERNMLLLGKLLIGNMQEEQKVRLHALLKQLDQFHSELYEQDKDHSLEDLLEKGGLTSNNNNR
ncbi:MAG: MarR family winged helix-turn-helix transcriptional regulator [bacterium]